MSPEMKELISYSRLTTDQKKINWLDAPSFLKHYFI